MEVPITNTTIIYYVSKYHPVPPIAVKVKRETAKLFILEDGTHVRKTSMSDTYRRYFTEKDEAEMYYKKSTKPEVSFNTNMCVLQEGDVNQVADVLFDMIQELCEDGMPTKDEIINWLNATK